MARLPIILAGVAAVGALATAAHAAGDRDFLHRALVGDNSQVSLGRLAQQKASLPQTRAFGAMLTADHTAAKAMALRIARDYGVPNTDAVAPEAHEEERRLEALSGPRFDREFALYVVKDHRQNIAAFEKQARQGDRATAELARQTLPDLRRHLKTAERLAR